MLVTQLAYEPNIRTAVRKQVYEKAYLQVRPTRLGMKDIQPEHVCWSVRFITDKPVNKLVRTEYLMIREAEEQGLLEVKLQMEKLQVNPNKPDFEQDFSTGADYEKPYTEVFVKVRNVIWSFSWGSKVF